LIKELSDLWWLLIAAAALIGYIVRGYRNNHFQNIGEVLVRNALIEHLKSNSWHLLNNVTLQLENHTTQVDHILVSRFGIFVIETKHYKGWIFGDERSKEWTQVIWKRKFKFQNPMHQNYKHVKAIQDILDFIPKEHIIGIVVFTGDAVFKTKQPQNVYSLESLIKYLKSLEQETLTENRLQFCVGRLECLRLALTRETDIEHINNLNNRFS
jgi:restriction system protein